MSEVYLWPLPRDHLLSTCRENWLSYEMSSVGPCDALLNWWLDVGAPRQPAIRHPHSHTNTLIQTQSNHMVLYIHLPSFTACASAAVSIDKCGFYAFFIDPERQWTNLHFINFFLFRKDNLMKYMKINWIFESQIDQHQND